MQKEIKIKTPYGIKNWSYLKRLMDNEAEMLEVIKVFAMLADKIDAWEQALYKAQELIRKVEVQ